MATATVQQMKIVGKAQGSSQMVPLQNLAQMSLANAFRTVADWFIAVAIGARSFSGYVMSNAVQAAGAITFSSFVDGDTITINGVVFTGKNSPVGAVQFAIGVSDTVTAANAVLIINASASNKVVNTVIASSVGAILTITCKECGQLGNLMTLAISAHGSVSTAVAGGTDGTVVTLSKGI